MIPEGEKRYIPEKDRGLFITIGPDIRATRHGRLLPCPMAKAAHRVAMLIGRPGAQLAKALSDAHDYYTHSPDIEAHREFQRRVWNWTIAARNVGKSLIESLGGGIAKKVGFTPTPITPPYTPPEPEMPRPECGDLCKLIGNACKASYRCYTTPTTVSGPGFVVQADTSIWWWDGTVRDRVTGVFWPTYPLDIIQPGHILERYSGFYCGRVGMRFIGNEIDTCDSDYCFFTTDWHRYLIIERGTQVIGPGSLILIGKIWFLTSRVKCETQCYFFPKRS